MKRSFARNDPNRIHMLGLILRPSSRIPIQLEPDLPQQATQLAARFKPACRTLQALRSDRNHHLAQLNQACTRLTLMLKAAWFAVEHRRRWEGLGSDLRLLYGLDRLGRKPPIRARRDLLAATARFLTGEAAAQAMGLAPLAYPSQEELTAAYRQMQAALNTIETNQLAIQETLQDIQPLRQSIDAFLQQVGAYLDYACRHFSPPRKRMVMRMFGFRFRKTEASSKTRPLEKVQQPVMAQAVTPVKEPSDISKGRLHATRRVGGRRPSLIRVCKGRQRPLLRVLGRRGRSVASKPLSPQPNGVLPRQAARSGRHGPLGSPNLSS